MKVGSFLASGSGEASDHLLVNNSISEFSGDEGRIITEHETPKLSNADDSMWSTPKLTKGMIKCSLPCMIQFFSALFVNNTTLHYISLKDDMDLYNGMSLGLNLISCFSFYVIFHSNIGFNAAAS